MVWVTAINLPKDQILKCELQVSAFNDWSDFLTTVMWV